MDASTVYTNIHQHISPIPMTDAVHILGEKWKQLLKVNSPVVQEYALSFGFDLNRNDIVYRIKQEFNPFRFVANENRKYEFKVGEGAMFKLLTAYINTQDPSLDGKVDKAKVHVLATRLEITLNQLKHVPDIHSAEKMGTWLYAWFRCDSVASNIVDDVIHQLEFQPQNLKLTFFKRIVLWFTKIF